MGFYFHEDILTCSFSVTHDDGFHFTEENIIILVCPDVGCRLRCFQIISVLIKLVDIDNNK